MTNTDTADVEATVAQVRDLARAGSELVRVTVNSAEAAAAVPHIRDRLRALGVTVPLIGDFHFNGHKLLREHPACAEALDKYRINPGQRRPRREARLAVRRDDRDRLPARQAGAHRRELGQPRPGPARAADGREQRAARACQRAAGHARGDRPLRARQRAARGRAGPAARADHPVGQGQRRAGPHRGLHEPRGALRLPAASRPHRGRHGLQGHRRLDRRHRRAAGAGDRRHDPRLADAGARRRPHAGSDRRAGDPADDGTARVPADGGRLPGLRSHHQHLFPGARAAHPVPHPPPHAAVEDRARRRRDDDGRGDGLRGQRPGREPARQHRHQPAGHRRAAGRAGLRGWREDGDAEGRTHRRGIPGPDGALHRAPLPEESAS